MGSPDPGVSTGFVHQLPIALPNLVVADPHAYLYAASASGSRQRFPLGIKAQTVRAFLLGSANAGTFAGRRAASQERAAASQYLTSGSRATRRAFGCGFGIHPTAKDYPGNIDVPDLLGV